MIRHRQNMSESAGSLERGVLTIHAFRDARGLLTLVNLSRQLDLAPSTVHCLLGALKKFGQAVREPREKRYLAAAQAQSPLGFQHPVIPLRLLSRLPLESLRELTGETSAFVLFRGYERLVMDFVIACFDNFSISVGKFDVPIVNKKTPVNVKRGLVS